MLQVFGGLGYMKDYQYERYLRDARILQIFEVGEPDNLNECLDGLLQKQYRWVSARKT